MAFPSKEDRGLDAASIAAICVLSGENMNIRGILLGTAAFALLAGPAMASSNTSQTDMRLDELERMVRDQDAEIQQLKAEDASEANEASQDQATAAQLEAVQNQMYESAAATKSAWWQNTKISGRMYFDASEYEQKANGTDVNSQKGVGFDIKRFYIGVDHKFDDVWSANITTDFLYDSSAKNATQIYIKKAYLDGHFDDAFDVRFGSTDMPWIPFAEGVYGYRYIENTLIDRVKLGNSADWGVHASGKFADGMIGYAVSAINGAGYKNPFGPSNQARLKSIDFEGRLSANFDNITLAIGGYDGKLGKDMQGATTHHTATRFNALAAYTDDNLRVGVEYFSANNFLNVANTTTDKDTGYSGFASYHFDPQWGVFGRYDWVEEKTTMANVLKPRDGYYNFGIEWSPAKIVSLSLVYKHDSVDHGAISEQNGSGSLGSACAPVTNTPPVCTQSGTYNEIGLFGMFQF